MKKYRLKKTAAALLASAIGFSALCAPAFAEALPGDVDLNGKIEAADARLALRTAVKLETLEGEGFRAADLDGDGSITTADARLILRLSVGLPIEELTQFDKLRKGTFCFTAAVTQEDGTVGDVELASTPNSLYLRSEIDGRELGVLIKKDTVYLISDEESAYLHLTSALLDNLGMSVNDFTKARELDFSKYDPAKAFSVTDAVYGGAACKDYIFRDIHEDGSVVYMHFLENGSELLGFYTMDGSGKILTETKITSFSSSVPAERKNPPAEYTAYEGLSGMFTFLGLLDA